MEHLCLSTGRDNFSLPGQAQAYPGLPPGQVNGDDHTDLDATLSEIFLGSALKRAPRESCT